MQEVTPGLVIKWLNIPEGSVEDLRRDLNKQPLREAAVLKRIEREKQKLNDLRQELRVKKLDLDQLIAKKVLQFKENSEKPPSAAAVENYRKYDLERDPQVMVLRSEIVRLEGRIADQQTVVDSWAALYEKLRTKSMILMANIKLEIALRTSNQNSLMETI